jgi:hypothetical protein
MRPEAQPAEGDAEHSTHCPLVVLHTGLVLGQSAFEEHVIAPRMFSGVVQPAIGHRKMLGAVEPLEP